MHYKYTAQPVFPTQMLLSDDLASTRCLANVLYVIVSQVSRTDLQ